MIKKVKKGKTTRKGIRTKSINKRRLTPPKGITPFQETEAGQSKRMLMWIGIIFFMILILGGWVLNLKNTFKASTVKEESEQEMNWSKMSSELSKTMAELKKGLNELKEVSKENSAAKPKEEMNLSPEEINKLKDKLESNKYNANTTN